MKVTKAELMQIIKEEVAAYKKVKLLENRKAQILRQLNEMDETMMEVKMCSECGRPMEEDSMEEGAFVDKIKNAVGLMTDAQKKAAITTMATDYYKGKFQDAQEESGETLDVLKNKFYTFIDKQGAAIEKNPQGKFYLRKNNTALVFNYDTQKKDWSVGESKMQRLGTMVGISEQRRKR